MIVFAFPVAVINSSKFPTNPRVSHRKTKCWQPSPCGFWLLLLLVLRWSMDRVVRTCPRSITNPVRSCVTWKSVSSIPSPFCVCGVTLLGKGIATERSRTKKGTPDFVVQQICGIHFPHRKRMSVRGIKALLQVPATELTSNTSSSCARCWVFNSNAVNGF